MVIIFCVAFASLVGQVVFNANIGAYVHNHNQSIPTPDHTLQPTPEPTLQPSPEPSLQPNPTLMDLFPKPADANATMADAFVLFGFHE